MSRMDTSTSMMACPCPFAVVSQFVQDIPNRALLNPAQTCGTASHNLGPNACAIALNASNAPRRVIPRFRCSDVSSLTPLSSRSESMPSCVGVKTGQTAGSEWIYVKRFCTTLSGALIGLFQYGVWTNDMKSDTARAARACSISDSSTFHQQARGPHTLMAFMMARTKGPCFSGTVCKANRADATAAPT